MFIFKLLKTKEKVLIILILFLIGFLWTFLFYLNYLKLPQVVEGFDQQPKTFNPLLAKNDVENSIASLLFRGLIRPDGKGNFKYDLAKKITFNSTTREYLIELKDAIWSDGSKITSDDVVFTFKAVKLLPESNYFSVFKDLEIEKIDYNSFKIKLNLDCQVVNENNFIFPYFTLGIIPQKIWSSLNFNDWLVISSNFYPLTSGPYKIKKIIKQENKFKEIIFELNNDILPYLEIKPKIKKIVFKFFDDKKEIFYSFKLHKINSFLIDDPQDLKNYNFKNYTKIVLPTYFALWSFDKELKNIFNYSNLNYLQKQFFNLRPIYIFDEKYLNKDLILSPTNKELQLFSTRTYEIFIPENNLLVKIIKNIKEKFYPAVKLEIAELDLKTFQEKILTDDKFLKENNFIFTEKYGIYPHLSFLKYQNAKIENWELVKLIETIKCEGFNKENLKKFEVLSQRSPYVFLFNLDWFWLGKDFDELILNNTWERFFKIIYN